jgi:hypothetical protein
LNMVAGTGYKIGLWLACVTLTAVSQLHASVLFEDDTPLEIRITGPMGTLVQKKQKRIEMPFTLAAGDHEIDVRIRSRGKSRMRVCDFPQLRMRFDAADTAGTPFEGQSKLKMVVRCRKGESAGQDVLEEYAVYRIFALLSDISYRVRLIHITFDDTDDRIFKGYRQGYGFLIEPLEQMASRVGGTVAEVPAVALKWMDDSQAALVYVFQYLVANTDWSFVAPEGEENCCHNISLVDIDSKLFPVPYDFDLTGLVNASYAFPDPSLHIKWVTQRVYRGFCTDDAVLRGALETVVSRQAEILNIIRNLPFDKEKERTDRIDYLQKFFSEAGDGNRMLAEFEKRCHP